MQKIALILCALSLTACGVMPLPQADISKCGPRPTEAQAEKAVQAYVQDSGFKDPNTVEVRNITIAQPNRLYRGLAAGGGWNYGWEIDFEANGKNSYGAYAGYELHSIILSPDGSVHWQDID